MSIAALTVADGDIYTYSTVIGELLLAMLDNIFNLLPMSAMVHVLAVICLGKV